MIFFNIFFDFFIKLFVINDINYSFLSYKSRPQYQNLSEKKVILIFLDLILWFLHRPVELKNYYYLK